MGAAPPMVGEKGEQFIIVVYVEVDAIQLNPWKGCDRVRQDD